jgi:uncharacterized protein with PIN domain
MSAAWFQFHGDLTAFLARDRRGGLFRAECARAATLKNTIEALGVPHTEVGRVTVAGEPATLARIVRDGDRIEVFPHEAGSAPFESPLAFIADAHMGGLARVLRMLGFDTVYDNALADARIVEQALHERRVVLTRDRELLKCRDVLRGCYVRALKPEAQLRELARRYDLVARMHPFTLCLHCNRSLAPVDSGAVSQHVPERIRERYHDFRRCPGCERIYWEGSHWTRMRSVLAETLELAPAQIAPDRAAPTGDAVPATDAPQRRVLPLT